MRACVRQCPLWLPEEQSAGQKSDDGMRCLLETQIEHIPKSLLIPIGNVFAAFLNGLEPHRSAHTSLEMYFFASSCLDMRACLHF